jgi:hypothetical protein
LFENPDSVETVALVRPDPDVPGGIALAHHQLFPSRADAIAFAERNDMGVEGKDWEAREVLSGRAGYEEMRRRRWV